MQTRHPLQVNTLPENPHVFNTISTEDWRRSIWHGRHRPNALREEIRRRLGGLPTEKHLSPGVGPAAGEKSPSFTGRGSANFPATTGPACGDILTSIKT
jgi:hypothetical protein